MDHIQEKHERAVGDKFIIWHNERFGKSFAYISRGIPDLTYNDGNKNIHLEITDAYYDQRDAAIKWQNARGQPNAPKEWSGKNCDGNLIDDINMRIEEKCRKSYGNNCILIINIFPYLTSSREIEIKLHGIKIPETNPFLKIYLTGDFPYSTKSQGGYQCWEISTSK